MEKLSALFKLGIKYLYRYRKRYGFLLAALVFCFAIVTFITSVKDGMYDNVYYTAQSHYAGDIVAMGCYADTYRRHMGINEISSILEAAGISGVNPRNTVKRTFGVAGVVYYNGAGIELKYLQGCDWENEADLFGRMNYTEKSEFPFGEDGIILSVPIARQLNANVGDRVIIEIETKNEQKNTGFFILKGIVEDTSIFGYYKAYVERKALNRLLLYDDEDCSIIGFYLDDPAAAEEKRSNLQEVLSKEIQTGPLVYDRDGMERETRQSWEGNRVFLFTLPVYLTEISDLLDAMDIITYIIYGMMLLIILVSAVVTYRLILHERTKEMGIMRTIGFYGRDMHLVLWTEILALGFISLVAGFSLAWLLGGALSLLSFSWFPSFEIFMKNGRLTALYKPLTIMLHVVFIYLILVVSAFFPVLKASHKNLPGLLSGEPL